MRQTGPNGPDTIRAVCMTGRGKNLRACCAAKPSDVTGAGNRATTEGMCGASRADDAYAFARWRTAGPFG